MKRRNRIPAKPCLCSSSSRYQSREVQSVTNQTQAEKAAARFDALYGAKA